MMATDPEWTEGVIGFATRVGAFVAERWDGRHQSFADLALAALSSCGWPTGDPISEIFSWVARTVDLPHQDDPNSNFGQPPVTLYRTKGFRIDALIWREGTTLIHNHGFDGAFSVITGKSVHSEFDFAPQESPSRRLRLGELSRSSVEILRTGDSRAIASGEDFIHALFHLTQPTLSLVVRTNAGTEPLWGYLRGGVAYDSSGCDTAMLRRTQIVAAALSLRPDQAGQLVEDVARHAEVFDLLMLFMYIARVLPDGLVFRNLVGRACRVCQPLTLLSDALTHWRRDQAIESLRHSLVDERERTVLAVLAMAGEVPGIDSLISEVLQTPEYRKSPHAGLFRQLSEIAASPPGRLSVPVAEFAELLGVVGPTSHHDQTEAI